MALPLAAGCAVCLRVGELPAMLCLLHPCPRMALALAAGPWLLCCLSVCVRSACHITYHASSKTRITLHCACCACCRRRRQPQEVEAAPGRLPAQLPAAAAGRLKGSSMPLCFSGVLPPRSCCAAVCRTRSQPVSCAVCVDPGSYPGRVPSALHLQAIVNCLAVNQDGVMASGEWQCAARIAEQTASAAAESAAQQAAICLPLQVPSAAWQNY